MLNCQSEEAQSYDNTKRAESGEGGDEGGVDLVLGDALDGDDFNAEGGVVVKLFVEERGNVVQVPANVARKDADGKDIVVWGKADGADGEEEGLGGGEDAGEEGELGKRLDGNCGLEEVTDMGYCDCLSVDCHCSFAWGGRITVSDLNLRRFTRVRTDDGQKPDQV